MILTFKNYLSIGFLAFFTAVFIDYLAKNLVGQYLSLAMFMIILIITLFDYKKGVFGFIFLSLIIPQFSRSLISEVVESDNLNVSGFYSFHSTTIAGFALPILFIVIAGVIAFFRLCNSNGKVFEISPSEPLIWFFIIIFVLVLSTFLNVIDGRENEIRGIISDLRLVFIWIFGVLIYKYISLITTEEERFRLLFLTLLFSVLVIGSRTIFFVVLDILNKTKSFDFATQPYIGYPIVFAIIYAFNKSKLKWIFIALSSFAAFSLKRSDLAFVALLLIVYFTVGLISRQKKFQYASFISIIYLSIIALLISYILLFFAEDAFFFLLYKLNFFTTEMWQGELSNSALVRQLELINIFNDGIDRLYPIFIGSGLGGYFDFSYTSKPPFIGVSDFSSAEIASNKFTRPHTFLNYIGLKGGVLYLIFYVMLIFSLFMKGVEAIKLNRRLYNKPSVEVNVVLLFAIGYSVFCLNMFWQPIHLFLFVFILSMIFDYIKEKKNAVNNS
ncbi:hypothetical protein [Vibrio vulnificus]|uniref:hypothetical protein n=1 Tax=Vibrio vulnificus TaxID=672 RepID=UPI00071FC690|nr:hypothetical protein [Vibrio vulnificus]ALM72125.1 hypothetical protein FORC9_2608 [Vibrio vulnificus]ANH62072.1 hypothetical protein FORC16_0189 [Vibrio vulnificus]